MTGVSEVETELKSLIKYLIECPPRTRDGLSKAKLRAVKALGLNRIPANTEIAESMGDDAPEWLRSLVVKKPVKTGSGVSVLTVVAPLYSCPHGKCIYCPGGLESGTPQSYTGREPVIREANEVFYSPHHQVRRKIEKLRRMGHNVDKVELIIIGGTFTAAPPSFQREFIKGCLDAIIGSSSPDLETALRMAEKTAIHISGITIETKPDWAKLPIASRLVDMGVTRVELGVQALDDDILRQVNRGHSVADVVEATRDLRDLSFKICYHMMPNLPGSSPVKDLEMLCRLFESEDFRPDMLKIYPTLVLPGTGLEKLWRRGLYQPYGDGELMKVLVEFFRRVPRYVRVNRVQREIPLDYALTGSSVSNLRQEVENRLGEGCRCIRCREVGRRGSDQRSISLNYIKYRAGGGDEWFISFEDVDTDSLIGFIRLRIPPRVVRSELEDAGLVRELHVYGSMTPVGYRLNGQTAQHKGFGRRLLSEAERVVAEEYGLGGVAVISGVGVRGYYRKMGYSLEGPYMFKRLR
ncbi:MAG: tRNA uridine(34) 5-carboxymethylaminomethyl modification radical SAM/GNAT enzyme Elp3 [Nitrososphaerota archaeon]